MNDHRANFTEWSKRNEDGKLVCHIRSENERDLSAVVDDPTAEILTIASLAGLQVTVTGGTVMG